VRRRRAGIDRASVGSIASFALAVCASAALLVVPTSGAGYEEVVTVNGREGVHTSSHSSETLLQQGPLGYDLALLIVPIVVTVLPVLLRRYRWVIDVRGGALAILVFIVPLGTRT
jgi:hypothetical protein